ncbi:MAG: hypothetical protein ABSC56_11090 [Solirubrobacteraceae bacterium]
MFVLATVAYPWLLELLCVGAGLLVDRLSGRFVPAVLLPALGAATLIALSQLTTYTPTTAPLTPLLLALVGASGIALEWRRIWRAVRRPASRRWQLWLPAIVYCVALAPVLASGEVSFSAYNVLTDSAFHMMGADYLIRHGQDYAHIDLRNSYGQYLHAYYGTGYPSGVDTLFGGSAFILGVPLIWAFQPFTAFILALAAGPAWLLARRAGLSGIWAALAGLTATVPALVYAYGLIGSIKEITGLALLLSLGALVVMHERWLTGPPRRALPFALIAAAGVSVLGIGFGAWILACAVPLAAVVVYEVAQRRRRVRDVLLLVLAGVGVAAVAAWPTWSHASAAVQSASSIATTHSPGNLTTPLQLVQVFGTWLSGLYTSSPRGTNAVLSYAAIAVTAVLALAGANHLRQNREHVLGGWIAALVVLLAVVLAYATTWVDAKTLMLSSPLVLLLAWSGIAVILQAGNKPVACVFALLLTAGVIASDVMQYRATDLAPPARYAELASLDTRFAGRGPTLFTDWDEYALYVLRDLDVGGPNFLFPPPALAHLASTHSAPINLDGIAPRKLLAYPLIITRVDPVASRPAAAYRLLWRGTYYEVWGRQRGAPAALVHLGLYASRGVRCRRVEPVAAVAARYGGHLVVALAPQIVNVRLNSPSPAGSYVNGQLELTSDSAGASVTFRVPRSGAWDLWLRGEIMPTVAVRVDGRLVGRLADQLAGNDFNPDTIGPLRLDLRAGGHRLSFAAAGSSLAPGATGDASLARVFLTTAAGARQEVLRAVRASAWRSLCGGHFDWIEAVR